MQVPAQSPNEGCLSLYVTLFPREALSTFNARQLRLMFVLQPWNKTMVYGEQSRAEMKAREAQLRNFFQNVDAAVRGLDINTTGQRWAVSLGAAARNHEKQHSPLDRLVMPVSRRTQTTTPSDQLPMGGALVQTLCTPPAPTPSLRVNRASLNPNLASGSPSFPFPQPEEFELSARIQEAQRAVDIALRDNFNTPAAMDALSDMVKAVNAYLAAKQKAAALPLPMLLRKATAFATRILSVFGIVDGPSDRWGTAALAMRSGCLPQSHPCGTLSHLAPCPVRSSAPKSY